MNIQTQIAKQIRDVYFGGNWTASNLKEHLSDVTWEQATTKIHSLNTIAVIVFHMNYYVNALLFVLQGERLTARDKFSFDLPPVQSKQDWEKLLDQGWSNAEKLTQLIEKIPENKLWEDFSENKYGNYYRNIHGVIEHCHYHLGQIVLIKKLILSKEI